MNALCYIVAPVGANRQIELMRQGNVLYLRIRCDLPVQQPWRRQAYPGAVPADRIAGYFMGALLSLV